MFFTARVAADLCPFMMRTSRDTQSNAVHDVVRFGRDGAFTSPQRRSEIQGRQGVSLVQELSIIIKRKRLIWSVRFHSFAV